jgi:hypothetical protein
LPSRTMRTLLSLVIVCSSYTKFAIGITTRSTTTILLPLAATSRNGRSSLPFLCERLRGGATSDSSKKKKRKKKSKGSSASDGKAKKAIDDAMKEKDSAEALGDAIR